MNIVFVTSEYPHLGKTGGIATYTQDSARWLTQNGHKVYVVCPVRNQPPRIEIDQDVRVHYIKPVRIKPRRLILYASKVFHSRALAEAYAGWDLLENSISVWRKVRELSANKDIDIIEVPDTFGMGFWILLWPGRKTPVIVRSHGILEKRWMQKAWDGGEFQSFLERYSIRHSDFVLTASYERISHYKDCLQLRKNDIECVHYGINITVYKTKNLNQNQPKVSTNVLYLGRIEHRKGCDVFLDALEIVLTQTQTIFAQFVGAISPEMATSFKSFLERWSSRVIYIDWVPPLETRAILEEADVIVLPSRYETLPRVLIEALAAGVPQIATRVNGIPEIVQHNETGFLIELDCREIADKIIKLCTHKELRLHMSQASQVRAKQVFDIDNVMQNQTSIYEKILSTYK